MSTFDPEAFMNESIEEANDTVVIPIPVGEYQAQIEKVEARPVTVKEEERAVLEVHYNILDDKVKEITGRDKVMIRQTIWLDLDPQGRLDVSKGKNVGLGKLREACDLNTSGKAFNPTQFAGNIVTIKVGQRPNKDDPANPYSDVKSVGKAA